jgi:predicted lipid-binding transport protein (Tim44 family)
MKRIGLGITFVLLWTQASLALARGGGGVGGSLGGSSGGSVGGGSFSGGGASGGGLGGFFPMPFFFFGGSGGSGSGGILSLLFLIVIVYFVYKTLRSSRRWGQGRSSKGHGLGTGGWDDNSNQQPVDLNGKPITNSDSLQRFGKSINFTRENMRYYAETFPRWDRDALIGRVRQVFFWLQDGWSRQDLSAAKDYLATTLGNKYEADLQAMKARGERNMIKEPLLNTGDIEFIHSQLDEQTQHFMAMVSASLIDYTVNTSERLIAGDDKHRLYYTEFWEFIFQDDKWLLVNIYQEDAIEVAKIARGEDE